MTVTTTRSTQKGTTMETLTETRSGYVAVGVDTHKHLHVAAVMDAVAGMLDTITIPADTSGFTRLLSWAASYGKILIFGIEGHWLLWGRADVISAPAGPGCGRGRPTRSPTAPHARKIRYPRCPLTPPGPR